MIVGNGTAYARRFLIAKKYPPPLPPSVSRLAGRRDADARRLVLLPCREGK